MFRKKVLTRNGINITRNGAYAYRDVEFPNPIIPSDMHFIYLANNFDGSKIPNSALESDMGDYVQVGTLTKNGSGSDCYLSNNLSNNYLSITLTQSQLDLMKANEGTYTYFIRVIQTNQGLGGILSWRSQGSYVYMIRCFAQQIQLHRNSGTNLGTENFSIATDNVYKIVVNGNNYYAKNLTTNATWSDTNSTTKNMGLEMRTFQAGYSGEDDLDRFYGVAGISRATTDEEDEAIKTYLMTQGV